jgi:chitodextrinase
VNGGAWTSVALPSRLAQVVKTSLSLTAKTRFRVRARDKVGNWSPWRYGPTIKGSAYQESSPYLRWSNGWSRTASTAWMGGVAATSIRAGAASAFVFTGRSFGWVGRKGPDGGLVRVLVDGKVVGTVDLRSPTVGPRTVLWAATWLATSTHVIRLENLGTAGSPGVVVDAFLTVR